MKIEAVEIRRVRLPLVRPFRTSFGTETVHEVLLVHVDTALGGGWGECVTGAEPLYSSEFVDAAWLAMRRFFVPTLLEQSSLTAASVATALRGFKGHRMAKAALEMAVLDAELRAAGMSLQQYLGGTGDVVTPGVSVGITDTLGELLDVVDGYLEDGYRRVKLKIEPGWDIEIVGAVRDRVGDAFMLQVDANTAYERRDIGHLAKLDDFGLLLIEQPLDEEDILGHAQLAERLTTPVCLDESIVSARAAADAIALGACSVVNVKPGRVGGYLEARKVHDVCVAHGVPVWCGGMLETGIGRAANLALATMPGFVLPGDISATRRYFDEDVTAPFVLVDGAIAVPSGPGIGVDVVPSALEAFTSEVEVIGRGDR
jgi:o-succinylbenzoate synthase